MRFNNKIQCSKTVHINGSSIWDNLTAISDDYFEQIYSIWMINVCTAFKVQLSNL